MQLYKDFIDTQKQNIEDYFKNVSLHESQFNFTDFNKICVDEMYTKNEQSNIKTVAELKKCIPELKDTCKKCGDYFMKQRNNSVKGLDVQMGEFLEKQIMEYLNNKLKIKAMKADKTNRKYPDCMILNTDKGILAYFEVKYHGAPFLTAINKIGRYCYEGSATLDFNKVKNQLDIIYSDLERPVFYLHWIDYPCIKGLFFETSDQVKQYLIESGEEFDRADRTGDFININRDGYEVVHKVGYTKKFYSPLLQMGTFEEFIEIIKDMKKNGVRME